MMMMMIIIIIIIIIIITITIIFPYFSIKWLPSLNGHKCLSHKSHFFRSKELLGKWHTSVRFLNVGTKHCHDHDGEMTI